MLTVEDQNIVNVRKKGHEIKEHLWEETALQIAEHREIRDSGGAQAEN